jgi:putative peptidoglycan lipid II flippase
VHVAGGYLAQLSAFRDETMLLLLMITGVIVYGVVVLALFGRSGLRALIRT